jgi:hypothetical protein
MTKITSIGMPLVADLPGIDECKTEPAFEIMLDFEAISMNRYIALHPMQRMKLRRLERLIIEHELSCELIKRWDEKLVILETLRHEIVSTSKKSKERAKEMRKHTLYKKLLPAIKKKTYDKPPLGRPLGFATDVDDQAIHIHFTHYRKRLLDIDNYVTKHIIDSFARVGLISSDDPSFCRAVTHSHCKNDDLGYSTIHVRVEKYELADDE